VSFILRLSKQSSLQPETAPPSYDTLKLILIYHIRKRTIKINFDIEIGDAEIVLKLYRKRVGRQSAAS
jgi:hypothetical protein